MYYFQESFYPSSSHDRRLWGILRDCFFKNLPPSAALRLILQDQRLAFERQPCRSRKGGAFAVRSKRLFYARYSLGWKLIPPAEMSFHVVPAESLEPRLVRLPVEFRLALTEPSLMDFSTREDVVLERQTEISWNESYPHRTGRPAHHDPAQPC